MPLMHDATAVNGRWARSGIFKKSLKFEYLINKGRLKTGIVGFQTTFAVFSNRWIWFCNQYGQLEPSVLRTVESVISMRQFGVLLELPYIPNNQIYIMSTETKNYITPVGWQALKDELYQLVNKERPEIVQIVNWAASNGDRSENGDYLYGKRRMREIDRRIRFLTKRLEAAVVVDPELREATDQVFFGATVGLLRGDGREQTVKIVGVDEIDTAQNKISWISPLARCLIKAREGDEVILNTPEGREEIEILSVEYIRID